MQRGQNSMTTLAPHLLPPGLSKEQALLAYAMMETQLESEAEEHDHEKLLGIAKKSLGSSTNKEALKVLRQTKACPSTISSTASTVSGCTGSQSIAFTERQSEWSACDMQSEDDASPHTSASVSGELDPANCLGVPVMSKDDDDWLLVEAIRMAHLGDAFAKSGALQRSNLKLLRKALVQEVGRMLQLEDIAKRGGIGYAAEQGAAFDDTLHIAGAEAMHRAGNSHLKGPSHFGGEHRSPFVPNQVAPNGGNKHTSKHMLPQRCMVSQKHCAADGSGGSIRSTLLSRNDAAVMQQTVTQYAFISAADDIQTSFQTLVSCAPLCKSGQNILRDTCATMVPDRRPTGDLASIFNNENESQGQPAAASSLIYSRKCDGTTADQQESDYHVLHLSL
jgi:hypothetical protein